MHIKFEKQQYSTSPNMAPMTFIFFLRFYLFIFRERAREREREGDKHRCVRDQLLLACVQLGTWTTTQACALTGNQTSHPLVLRPVLSLPNHTSQGPGIFLKQTQNYVTSLFRIAILFFSYCLFIYS